MYFRQHNHTQGDMASTAVPILTSNIPLLSVTQMMACHLNMNCLLQRLNYLQQVALLVPAGYKLKLSKCRKFATC